MLCRIIFTIKQQFYKGESMKQIKLIMPEKDQKYFEEVKGYIRFVKGCPIKVKPYVRKAKYWKYIPLMG